MFHAYRIVKAGPNVTLLVDGTPQVTVPYTALPLRQSPSLIWLGSTSIIGTADFDLRQSCYNPICATLACNLPSVTDTGLSGIITILGALAVVTLVRNARLENATKSTG